jgi:hypothetical protein
VTPLDAALAVGGPNLVSGEGWDWAPLLMAAALLLLMRWARIPVRLPAILVAVTASLLLDPLTDAFHVSLLTTLALLVLIFGIVALRRTPSHRASGQV